MGKQRQEKGNGNPLSQNQKANSCILDISGHQITVLHHTTSPTYIVHLLKSEIKRETNSNSSKCKCLLKMYIE